MESGGIILTKYFIDSYILWWYHVESSRYHKKVKKFLDKLILDMSNNFVINESVMIEFMQLLIRHQGVEGYAVAQQFLEEQSVIKLEFDMQSSDHMLGILDKLNIYESSSIGGRSASILHSMEKHRISNIITVDDNFTKVPGVEIHNPVLKDRRWIKEKQSLAERLRSQFQ
jgi:predicted nucleic acid-binding protein